MPVFKAYFIIIKKTLPALIVYFGVFVTMAIIFVGMSGTKTSAEFKSVKKQNHHPERGNDAAHQAD